MLAKLPCLWHSSESWQRTTVCITPRHVTVFGLCDQSTYTMPKQQRSKDDNINVNDLTAAINMDKGLIDGLLQFNCDELAMLIAHVANEANITTTTFKITRTNLPSFSVTKWSNLAEQFGLSQNIEQLELESFTTAKYHLPPSLHEVMFENA
jgi:hypothetical protein